MYSCQNKITSGTSCVRGKGLKCSESQKREIVMLYVVNYLKSAISVDSFNTRPTNPWTCEQRFAILFSCFTLSVACRTDCWCRKRLRPVSKGYVFCARRENCKYFKTFQGSCYVCSADKLDLGFALFDQFFVINPVEKLCSGLWSSVGRRSC